MSATSMITEADVRLLVDTTIFERGKAYFQQGAVLQLMQRGNVLHAEVQGSDWEPYRVQVIFDAEGIDAAGCSCPYGEEWGGVCKHTIATLLAYLNAPERAEQRSPLDELLRDFDADQLRELCRRLVAHQPVLADLIEVEALALADPAVERSAALAHAPTIRRQVRAVLHSRNRTRSSEDYWHGGSGVGDITSIVSAADRYLAAGDARGALEMLEAVTEEFVAGFELLDDSDGDVGTLFDTLGERWTHALLRAELPRAELERWAELLTDWQDTVSSYGIAAFDAAIDAAELGWDDPALGRVLRGESATLWPGGRPTHADALTQARLAVLEQEGREEEYLRLARAEGQTLAYTRMLITLGRFEEAAAYGQSQIETPFDALKLAQTLDEHGAVDAALRIAEHGFQLQPRSLPVRFPGAPPTALMPESPLTNGQTHLARWLRERATARDRPELALRAALFAARTSADLPDHRAVQALVGERWPLVRDELLRGYHALTGYSQASGKVDVYLHEQLWDDAIVVADRQMAGPLVERVADAVLDHRPDWVSRLARRHAEAIMEQTQSSKYDEAIAWLRRDRAAARVSGSEAAWRGYVADLIKRHRRKYKLVPMLEALLDR